MNLLWTNFSIMTLKSRINPYHDNRSFTFYVDVCFPLSLSRRLRDLDVYMSKKTGVVYKKQELFTLR
jgi:hypothetical protein